MTEVDKCMIQFVFDDGGRLAAGYKGKTGDCTTRAIAIASGLTYQEVYDLVNYYGARERKSKRRSKSGARTGIYRPTIQKLMEHLGWSWIPTMGIGTGCKVHVKSDELPAGRLVLSLSGHLAAVISGVLHDTYDCSRNGTRCVYGYWTGPECTAITVPEHPKRRPSIEQMQKRRLREVVRKLDCEIEEGYTGTFVIDSPKGKIFKASGDHSIYCDSAKEALKMLRYGIEECDIVECEVCNDLCDCNDPNCPSNHPNR